MSVSDALEGGDHVEALKSTAHALAVMLDGPSSATSKSMCAKALVDVLRELRELAPPAEVEDDLSRLRDERERRRERFAAAADPAGP